MPTRKLEGESLDEPTVDRRGWRWAWPVLLLFLITLAVFSPVLGHRFIGTWDDPTAIVFNADYNPPRWHNLIHYWTRVPAKGLFYVPVTYTVWGAVAFAARHSAPPGVPFNPAFFYGINLVAHAASAAMVFLVLRRLVRPRWAAWAGAAVFALHPIQVEAVASAWSMYTPLSAAFAFFAMWQYLRWSDWRRSDVPRERAIAWRHYALGFAGFSLALLTKPTVAAAPLMLAAIELGLRGRRVRDVAVPLAPWLIAALVIVWFNQQVPAAGRVYVPDAWLRPMVPLDAITFYLGKVLWPVGLCMDYGRQPWIIAGKPAIRPTCLIAVAVIAAAWAVRRRWPVVTTALAVFVLALLPSSGIVPFTFQCFSTVADRYAYLAMLGPALAVAALLARVRGRAVMAGASIGIVAMAAGSVLQLRHWQDDWKLSAHTITVNPRSFAAIAALQSLVPEARPSQPRLAQVRDLAGPCTLGRSDLLDLGDRLSGTRSYALAAACDRRALSMGPPEARIYSRLGAALAHDRDTYSEAAQACRQALQLDPNDCIARSTLEELAADGR